MLSEIKEVKQHKDEAHRRWFLDNYFDLIVWQNDDEITGFQLCYDKQNKERSLTWLKGRGFSHNKIDDGEGRPGQSKMTPILVPDGEFAKRKISEIFKAQSSNIDPKVAGFVYSILLTFPE
jgi:hypothetical protein